VTTLTVQHRREIDLAKEQLVADAEKLLLKVGLKDVDRNQFGHSQLRNLSAVAAETQSPAVVSNFIRFQIGRDNGRDPEKKGWAKKVGTRRLGELFIEALEGQEATIPQLAHRIAGEGASAVTVQLVRIELIRHFLGFAGRYLKFLDLDRPDKSKAAAGGAA
jgi:hypothetical protein